MMINKEEWYELVGDKIKEDIQGFYKNIYGIEYLKKVGANSYRVNPCPVCGHKECCTIKEGMIKCFSGSCDWKGTHITAWFKYATDILKMSHGQALAKIEEFSGIMYPMENDEQRQAYEKQRRIQMIKQFAEEFYHDQLMKCQKMYSFGNKSYKPLDYLKEVRKRKDDTIKEFKIGFSLNYLELRSELLSMDYTAEEIKEAKIWIPEGVFVMHYRHPITRDIVRYNTKNPFKSRFKSKDEFQRDIEGDIIVGFSNGSKVLYTPSDVDFGEDIIVIEGEHDMYALIENGAKNVCAIGGNMERESQLYLLRKIPPGKVVYLMYDNDEAGDEYVKFTNDYLADKDVRVVKYSRDYNDPDEYYVECDEAEPINKLLEGAEKLTTDKYVSNHFANKWSIATRDRRLDFTLKGKNEKGNLTGSVAYYANNILQDREEDIALMKCKAKMKPLNFHLHDEMSKYFDSNLEKKTVEELVSIYRYSGHKQKIIKILAEELFKVENNEDLVNYLKVKFNETMGSNDIVDSILKELNDIQNRSSSISFTDIPKMKICQYFNVKNNDAYMYFTYVKADGDVNRKLPFLLRNDGTLIRLDLLKRKDAQCLLLVDNKYELPFEVTEAILDLRECSLTQDWVEKFVDGDVREEELKPGYLVREIEKYIKKFYYTVDKNMYKVLALYIYATYYYELFGQMPYLFLNGEKGSGKSILDTVIYMLAFDAKMAVDISESSLFRMVSVEGGTIILDEMENLTSRKSTQDSTMAAALKGGYARSGLIYRFNKEKAAVEGFNVYSPKVISNIFGLDDVIEDRCIQINSYRLKLTKDTKMEDPKYYLQEKLGEIRELTSKCVISALKEFQVLFDLYNNSLFETGNARLSQILTPIQAVAKLVDLDSTCGSDEPGEYESALMNFYNETLAGSKEGVDCDTPEGVIKRAVPTIARELYGLVPASEMDYTIPGNHKFAEPIKFDLKEGWFDITVAHIKCFIEEHMPGDSAFVRYIPRWVKTCYKIKPADVRRRVVHIENEDLLKEFKGNTRPKVNVFRFYFKDFIDTEKDFFKTPDEVVESKEVLF